MKSPGRYGYKLTPLTGALLKWKGCFSVTAMQIMSTSKVMQAAWLRWGKTYRHFNNTQQLLVVIRNVKKITNTNWPKLKLIQNCNFTYMKEFFCFGVHRHEIKVFVFIGWSLKRITTRQYKSHHLNTVTKMFLLFPHYILTKWDASEATMVNRFSTLMGDDFPYEQKKKSTDCSLTSRLIMLWKHA